MPISMKNEKHALKNCNGAREMAPWLKALNPDLEHARKCMGMCVVHINTGQQASMHKTNLKEELSV